MVYFIVAKNKDEVFQSYLLPGLNQHNIKCCIATDDYEGQNQSIFIKYNAGISAHIADNLKEDDVLVFSHEDVKLIDPNLVAKIELVFKEKQDVGMLGVTGTTELKESGGWWHSTPDKLRGHIVQEGNTNPVHLVKGAVGYFDDLCVIDGLLFCIRGRLILEGLRFDESYDYFHFYDVDTCLQVLERGYKIAIADILLQHKSQGDISKSKEWHENRDKMVKKWKDKGYTFPVSQKSFLNVNIQEIEV